LICDVAIENIIGIDINQMRTVATS